MNQAMRYSTEVIALKAGKSIAQGAPESVINEELLKELYGVELDIVEVKRASRLCIWLSKGKIVYD